jgi:PKD repeat protein
MRITLAVVVGIAALLVPGTAVAAPPVNDDFANAVDVSPLPFNQGVNIVEATHFESGEQGQCSIASTVWYAYTPSSDEVLRVSPSGSNFFGVVLNVYRQDGAGLGGLSFVGCSQWNTDLTVAAQAGETYFVQAGRIAWMSPGMLQLSISSIPPPSNDDFGNAESIGSLPFSDATDTSAGTGEGGEPNPSCNSTGQLAGSIWYRYTPSTDGWVSASTFGSNPTTAWAAYTGDSLGSLSQVACRTHSGRMTFAVEGGRTYTFLVGTLFGVKGNVAFQLDVAPDPVASFSRNIVDPSIYDTIQFFNFAFDPGDVGIASFEWDFGDGSTSTDPSPTHRYAGDGPYTVRFTAHTHDGRSATSEQVVPVATHDVAIAKLVAPQSARVGQTKSLLVSLRNARYAETVRVDLYRSTPSGFVPFASLTQSVPVKGGNRTTDFAYSYTFTSDDAALGTTNFKAVATIVNARDALPTNNEAISLQTKVGT